MVSTSKDFPFSVKKCFVVLERLDEESLRKCLQKHGLKLASQSRAERPMKQNKKNSQTRSISKKGTKRTRKKRNPDDFILERHRKKKRKRIKPLCYTDDESCNESSEIPAEHRVEYESADNSSPSNKFGKMPVQSEPEGISCDIISATAESTAVSPESEVRGELAEVGRKSESQLKNEIRPQHENACYGRTGYGEISSVVDSDVEIIKVCEKPCNEKQSATSSNSEMKKIIELSCTELVQLKEFEDDGYDSREGSEDETKTVIFEEEFQKDTDLEDVIEFEGKEISKKFNKREITNRKRQRLVKFKRKSMAGRNLAKIERKTKSRIAEGSGTGQDTSEKSSEDVSEECLKEVCGLVKRLHELSRIIAQLQREVPKNEEMSVHFNGVINAQQENFHREIRKGQKAIIKCYEKMLSFYSDTSQVALEIGKRTSLSVEDVVNVISLCILIEGRCEAEKCRNAGKPGIFPTATSPNGLEKIISDNFMKIIRKKINQIESLSGTAKQTRLQNKASSSFAFPCPQSNQQKYQTAQTKHQKNRNLLPLQPQEAVDNFAFPSSRNVVKQKLSNCFSPSQPNTPSKQENVAKSRGSPYSWPNSQNITNNFTTTPQRDDWQKRKEVSSTGFSHSQTNQVQETRNSCIPPLTNTQSNIKLPFSQSNTHQSITHTDFPPWEHSVLLKMLNQPISQPNNENTSCGLAKQKKKPSQSMNPSGLPQRQNVKKPTGSRPNNPSGVVNQHTALPNRPCDRPFKPAAKEKTVHSSGLPVMSSEEPRNNFEILRGFPNRTPQKYVLTSGLGHRGVNQTNPLLLDKALPSRVMGNQPAAPGGVVCHGAPTQNVRISQAFTNRVNYTLPQRNTLPGSSAMFLLNRPDGRPVESNNNCTYRVVGGLQSSESPSVTTSKSLPQQMPLGAAKCPLNTANFMFSIRMLDNSKVESDRRNCSTTITVKNSQIGVEQGVLDPTIPQKLTMRNSRLQAGPILNFEIDGTEVGEKSINPSTEAKKTSNELGNSDGEKSQSRVYVCAKDDCRNPGIRICKGCHSIIYCSATCQFKHWVQKHKAECYQLRALRD